jgi:hypothetical protein
MALVGVGAALYFSLAPRWPSEQLFRIVLGDHSPDVTEVRVRCGPWGATGSAASDDEWHREVTLRYPKGAAPRVVQYTPKLAEGDYLVEIEVGGGDGRVDTTDHHIHLAGGATTIDLSRPPPR